MRAGIDVMRYVWGEECERLVVGPSPDAPDYVRLHTDCVAAHEFWGKVDISLPPEMAEALGNALIQCATEVRGNK